MEIIKTSVFAAAGRQIAANFVDHMREVVIDILEHGHVALSLSLFLSFTSKSNGMKTLGDLVSTGLYRAFECYQMWSDSVNVLAVCDFYTPLSCRE